MNELVVVRIDHKTGRTKTYAYYELPPLIKKLAKELGWGEKKVRHQLEHEFVVTDTAYYKNERFA